MKKFIIIRIVLFSCLLFAGTLLGKTTLVEIQQAIAEQELNWVAGESWVTALSFEDQQRLCGALLPPPEALAARKISLPIAPRLPSQFDWRNQQGNWVTSVKQQGNCGSCWDFSAVAQVESWWKIKNNQPNGNPDLSEQFILSCSDAGNCSAGGTVGGALSVIQTTGIPPESCFPYSANDTLACSRKCPDWDQNLVTIPGWGYITLDEPLIDVLKSAILRHPISATYTVYEDFMYYSGGVYEYAWGNVVAGHAILIVGWDDANECWICKNSWGPNWGEQGYFRIKWGNCQIGTNAEFIWSEMIQDTLLVAPTVFDFQLSPDETRHTLLTLVNPSDQTLEFAIQDYEIPIKYHPDSLHAWDGLSWWCGDPALGGYANHWLQYLEISGLDLSQMTAPELTFRGLWAIEDPSASLPPYDGWDGFNVWISTDNGKNYQVIEPEFPRYNCKSLWSFGHPDQGWDFGPGIPGWGGKSNGWQEVKFNLSAYKSTQTKIRFAFASDMGLSTADDAGLLGVVLDDIFIRDGTIVIFNNHGSRDPKISQDGFGVQSAPWLDLDLSGGSILPHDSVFIKIMIDTQGLIPGNYRGKLRIASNLSASAVREINCNLLIPETTGMVPSTGRDSGLHFQLQQNYPNPFNLTTQIPFQIERSGNVKIVIFNMVGQQIRTLFDGLCASGKYTIAWDGRDNAGNEPSSGTYFIQIVAGADVVTRKTILLK